MHKYIFFYTGIFLQYRLNIRILNNNLRILAKQKKKTRLHKKESKLNATTIETKQQSYSYSARSVFHVFPPFMLSCLHDLRRTRDTSAQNRCVTEDCIWLLWHGTIAPGEFDIDAPGILKIDVVFIRTSSLYWRRAFMIAAQW